MAVPRKWVAVTPADGTTLPTMDALYVGGAGNVAFQTHDSATTVTVPAVAGGYILGQITKVLSTGTTATGLFALYN